MKGAPCASPQGIGYELVGVEANLHAYHGLQQIVLAVCVCQGILNLAGT